MTNVLVRDLSDATHAVLLRRARQRGQSLQQYLVAELDHLASTPTVEEVFRRVEDRSGGRVGLRQAVEDLADERPE